MINFKKLFSLFAKEDESIRKIPRSFNEALTLNGFTVSRENDPDRALRTLPDKSTKGGFIIFPASVGGNHLADREMARYVADRLAALTSQVPKAKKTNPVGGEPADEWEIAVGRFAQGTYLPLVQHSPDRIQYTEASISIEIMSVGPDQFVSLAKALAAEFVPNQLLIKTYPGNQYALIRF